MEDMRERIRFIFCVIFCFLQVSILGLFKLFGILETHSWKKQTVILFRHMNAGEAFVQWMVTRIQMAFLPALAYSDAALS